MIPPCRRPVLVLILLLALGLAACQPRASALPSADVLSPASPSPFAPVTAADTPTVTATFPPSETPTEAPTATTTPLPRPAIARVLILSIDGLRPDAIAMAPMPILQSLMALSAYTLTAQTIYPSSTLPAHTSMLTGLCPSKHGVDWNDYIPAFGYARGTDLFDLAHAAGYQTVMIVGKQKLRQITEPSSTDVFEFINDRDSVIIDQLVAAFPQDFGLLFIHFPTADWMGHEYGWLSWEQLSVLRRADEALGRLLAELQLRDLRRETLIIITADHGGHEHTHGSRLAEDMTIPWIVNGPGVIPMQLTTPVQVMDTAATAAWALGLPIPPEWDGLPVLEAFGLSFALRSLPACP